MVKIDSTTLATSTSTWYDIWQAVNSVAYMCIKQTNFGGKAFKIGRQQARKRTQVESGI